MRTSLIALGLLTAGLLVGAGAPRGARAAAPAPPAEWYDCTIEPRQVVELGSPLQGIVRRIGVDRGDVVKAGNVVVSLDDDIARVELALAEARASNDADIESAKARLAYETERTRRLERLVAKKVAPRADLDEARTQRRLAELELKSARGERRVSELELSRAKIYVAKHRIRSPVGGVVVERLIAPGEYASEQRPLLKIAEIDPLYVEVFADIAAWGRIVEGMAAEVRPVAPVGGTYRATVRVVDHVLDAASGTFGVRLVLPNPGLRLPAGVRCRVRFLAE